MPFWTSDAHLRSRIPIDNILEHSGVYGLLIFLGFEIVITDSDEPLDGIQIQLCLRLQ